MNATAQQSEILAAVSRIPYHQRTAFNLNKPNDWQDFQKWCTVLFRDELRDPHIQEYGRNGQNQRGIDLVAQRNGNPNDHVGVQCRNVEKPLKFGKILQDCRNALTYPEPLREIIFATTAPDDKGATDAAEQVERQLRAEGHDVRVVIYGWGQLQRLIARHDVAFSVFCPFILVPPPEPTVLAGPIQPDTSSLAAQLAPSIVAELRQLLAPSSLTPPMDKAGPPDAAAEDPALHARIDVFRDMFKEDNRPLEAERRLLGLLNAPGLDQKPWAHFRILANLGSIALQCGRETEAIARYEAAYALRPSDPNAKAHLAFARTFQGRYSEAMNLARDALSGSPCPEYAVGCLLQAAARSDWEGDPESLIPGGLVGTLHADIGLAEFFRRRNLPGWETKSMELSRRHPDVPEFKPINAIAVLALAVESGTTVLGGLGPVTTGDLMQAADDMRAFAERMLDMGFADKHDRHAHLNNACVLLRICGRYEEVEALLRRAGPTAFDAPLLRTQMAIALAALGRHEELVDLLGGDPDPENILFLAELTGTENPAAALERAMSVHSDDLRPELARLRWHLIAELSLKAGRLDSLQSAVAGLRSLAPSDPESDVFALRGERQAGLSDDDFRSRLRELAGSIPGDAPMSARYLLAIELRDACCAEDASKLLEGQVDLTRSTPTAVFFLQCLAESRRDGAFQAALNAASEVLRNHPKVLWTTAVHAWNMGDLHGAHQAISSLIEHDPKNARVHLFKLEILLRQDRVSDLIPYLAEPWENLSWSKLDDSFRLTSLLAHFGFVERAAAFAYRLYLENRENPRAWMTLSGLVLGKGDADRPTLWETPVVALDVAVDLKYDDGRTQFFVVEPDRHLRNLDSDAWGPEHPVVQTLMGLPKGARFTDGHGREGIISELRHKLIARFHYVLQNYEMRFPDQQGFQSISVAPGRPGGLDEMMAILKSRKEWVEQEQKQYLDGPWPLSLLALRLSLDTIEVADGLVSQGNKLKVALGIEPERQDALEAIHDNGGKGCVLDLLAFWTAWKLGILDVIVRTCGQIHIGQRVLDRLRMKRERLQRAAREGAKSASYEDGHVIVTEVAAGVVQEWLIDLDNAIIWLESSASVCPLVAGDEMPRELREHLSLAPSDIFDSLVLAWRNGLLLVTDDLPIRQIGKALGFHNSCWSQAVLLAARAKRYFDDESYVRCTAGLVSGGYNYTSVTGNDLATALRMDARTGHAPAQYFDTLIKTVGGKFAEPISHAHVVIDFLIQTWRDPSTEPYRKTSTSFLLRQLISGRHDDYGSILRAVILSVRSDAPLVNFLLYWARGHFIPYEKIWGKQPKTGESNKAESAPVGGSRRNRRKDKHT